MNSPEVERFLETSHLNALTLDKNDPNRLTTNLRITRGLFDQAQEEIKMVVGELNQECLHPSLIKPLIKTAKRGVTIEIIYSDGFTYPEKIARLIRGGIKLYQIKTRPDSHFLVVDGNHVMKEGNHQPSKGHPVYFMRNDSGLGELYRQEFEALLK